MIKSPQEMYEQLSHKGFVGTCISRTTGEEYEKWFRENHIKILEQSIEEKIKEIRK